MFKKKQKTQTTASKNKINFEEITLEDLDFSETTTLLKYKELYEETKRIIDLTKRNIVFSFGEEEKRMYLPSPNGENKRMFDCCINYKDSTLIFRNADNSYSSDVLCEIGFTPEGVFQLLKDKYNKDFSLIKEMAFKSFIKYLESLEIEEDDKDGKSN